MFSDPQFWVAFAFFAFILAVFNPIRKILTKNLDEQIQQIKNTITEAENLKNEAQITLSEIKKRQNDVKQEIVNIDKNIKNKIEEIKNESELKLKNQIEKKQNLANLKIEQLTREANNQIQNYITSTAINAVISILEKKLDDKTKQILIDNSIKEIGSVLKN